MLPIRMEAAALYGSTDGFSGSSGFQQKVGLGSFHGMYIKKSVIGRTRRVRFGRRVASSRSVCRFAPCNFRTANPNSELEDMS